MEARNDSLCDDGDEDFIDLELSISSSSPQFEFQNSIAANETETTTSPADELFYKGKLLPLYLSPRRRMVEIENLLLRPTTTTTTPLDSCNISPSESCRVSCELNPDDYFFEWSNELNSFVNNQPTKATWHNKLKLIKHSILANKLKASRAFLQKLFVKSACSDHSSANAAANPTIATILDEENTQRRSFSSAIKRHSPTKCLSSSSSNSNSNSSSGSSSFSLNSNGLNELQHLKRRSGSATEIECSIEGAIAHCKKSQSRIADHCRI